MGLFGSASDGSDSELDVQHWLMFENSVSFPLLTAILIKKIMRRKDSPNPFVGLPYYTGIVG
jgi:hypothetical protein